MGLTGAPRQMGTRELVVHAGTHKTASSYLQNRLFANRQGLADQGVHLDWPGRAGRKHKGLVQAMEEGRPAPWRRYLESAPSTARQVLVTAEQFTPAITEPGHLVFLESLAAAHRCRLRVLLVLRDQPDGLNALYAHTVRRLYHHHGFEAYLRQRRRLGGWDVNCHGWLEPLLSRPTIDLLLLPYRSPGGGSAPQAPATDPFLMLAGALGWSAPTGGWQPASRQAINTQVGRRGIALARRVAALISGHGIDPRSLRNTGGVIREIAEREGWTRDRFQGFDPPTYHRLRSELRPANDALAQKVWGVPWAEVFPACPQPQALDDAPTDPWEAARMEACVQEALARLLPPEAGPRQHG